jgi:uncharacterized protein
MPDWRVVGRKVLGTLLSCLLILALLYTGLCWIFWIFEPAFVFHLIPRPPVAPESAGLKGFSEVHLTTDDGARLYGWWRAPPPDHGAIVLFTGTGVTLSDYEPLIADFAAQGLGVLGIDYRGNGASEPAPASEAGWRADARAAYDFVHAAAPQAKIVAYGQSMGTGFALMLALDRPVAGVLLDSPYASVARLFTGGLPILRGVPLPAELMMANPISSEAAIRRIRAPVLMLHGTEDHAIPIAEARRLYAAAHQPKELIEVEGAGHASVWFGPAREHALAALATWTAP